VTEWGAVSNGPKHTSYQVYVNYKERIWQRGSYAPAAANLPPLMGQPFEAFPVRNHCEVLVEDLGPGDPATVAQIRNGLRCGGVRIVDRQRVDGTELLKIVPVVQQHQENPPGNVDEVLWVSASSYIPLRMSWRGPQQSFDVSVTFLRPTRANLALLKPTIPRGFRRIPFRAPSVPSS
jgi:hypothetical protein